LVTDEPPVFGPIFKYWICAGLNDLPNDIIFVIFFY